MIQFAPLQAATPLTRFFLFVALLLMCISFGAVVGNMVIKGVYGISIEPGVDLLELAKTNPNAVNALRLVQLISQLVGMLLPAVFFARLVNADVVDELGLENKAKGLSYLLVGCIAVAVLPLIDFTGWLNAQVDFPALFGEVGTAIKDQEDKATQLTNYFLQMDNVGELLYMLVVMAVLPAVAEELIFRGVFQKIATNLFKNKHAGVWVAATLFSMSHFQFYGFLPRLLLGAVLGYFYMYSRTLWLPILAHFLNNAIAVLGYYKAVETTDLLAGNAAWVWITISAILTIGLLWFFVKGEKKNPAHLADERDSSVVKQ